MESLRLKKIEEAYHHELAQLLLLEVKDPNLTGISITRVQMTPDLHLARVFFLTRGNQDNAPVVLKSFKKSKGFLKRALAQRIPMRYTPDLEFKLDQSLEGGTQIETLFSLLAEEKKKGKPSAS
jgi:ribosome-binding factor A